MCMNGKVTIESGHFFPYDQAMSRLVKVHGKHSRSFVEVDNSREGIHWSIKKRVRVLAALYDQFRLLTPYTYKPFVKSFKSFKEYEKWKKKQSNPWFF